MQIHFRKAKRADIEPIWEILQQAILRRKADGSNQWQDGYPNLGVVKMDIDNGNGYVLTDDNTIIGYVAVLINDEPQYQGIHGKWLSNGDFVVFHRIAIAQAYLGKGFAKKIFQYIEEFARENKIYSVKVDTNYDNMAMLALFDKLGYSLCGEVYFRGSPRLAFEKVLCKPFV